MPVPPAAYAVFPALQALPQEEPQHVQAVLALRVEELAAVVQAHSGWAPAEGLAPRSVDGSFLADYSVAPLLVDGWALAAYLSQAGWGEQHCSLDARPACSQLAELPPA